MSYRADPRFLLELEKYGAVNIKSCFNCGNCTAVCPLSTGAESFPRRMIRYAQLGIREKLLSSKELWLCYYCGECTATCPRQADPGEFMATARRYAIARYDRLGLAKWFYTSAVFSALFLTVLAVVLSVFLYSFHGPMPGDTLRLFEFIPSEVVHTFGVMAGIVVLFMAISGVATMVVQVGKGTGLTQASPLNWLSALWQALTEILGQINYRQDCEQSTKAQPWFVHASMLWGFLGLFLATALDYLLELIGVKPTGTWVPIWYPVRFLGTAAGVLLIYGVTVAIIKRWRRSDEASAHSTPSDWAFLVLLWLCGVTGFALEISIYLPPPATWGYWTLLAHLVVVGELLILWPFTKFAHAIYRPLALFIHALKSIPEPALADAGVTN